jgi:GNAT superfamily N-acetyltransferase
MSVSIVCCDAREIEAQLDGLCELLRDVVDGGASVNFVAPLDADVARSYWMRVAGEVQTGHRVVVAAIEDGQIVGCAHLVPAQQPNGPHRAEVQKVLVHGAHRRKGIAQALMTAIENEAQRLGRWLIVLDTETGSAAVGLYEKLGYTDVGGVPEFALSSDGSAFRANVIFYKRLDGSSPTE